MSEPLVRPIRQCWRKSSVMVGFLTSRLRLSPLSRKRLVRNPTMTDDFLQHCLIGLTNGSLIALIALGYTMVYGIIELVNFAHGDLVMLGSFLALTLLGALGLSDASPAMIGLGVALILVFAAVFCAILNVAVDRVVYRPLRGAPKLVPLVSAIGVSFVLMNVGL